MNKKLRAALKAAGYTGEFTDAALSAWLAENPLDVIAPDGAKMDAKAIVAAVCAKQPKSVILEDEDEPDNTGELRDAVKRIEKQVADLAKQPNKTAAVVTPKAWRRQIEAKAYDRRVQDRANIPLSSRPVFKCAEAAEAFGAFARLNIAGAVRDFADYEAKSEDVEIVKSFVTGTKASSTLDPFKGGSLVPEAFQAMLIDLKEEFGVARQFFSVVSMPGDKMSVPKHVNDPTVYFPGEGGSITASDPSNATVSLSAVKAAVLVQLSSELMNDSAIPMGDYIARTAGRALAKKEDQMAFVGDGDGPTYGGAVGATSALSGLSSTVANIAGLEVASGNAWSEIVDNDVYEMLGRLTNQYHGSARFVCSRQFYFQVLVPFLVAGGGVSQAELAGGLPRSFAGYPILLSQAMPTTEANSQVCLLCGDGANAGYIGDVINGQSMSMSEHRYFDSDQIAFKVTSRVAVNIYGVGNASATASEREAGSIVGLITAAS